MVVTQKRPGANEASLQKASSKRLIEESQWINMMAYTRKELRDICWAVAALIVNSRHIQSEISNAFNKSTTQRNENALREATG